MNPDTARIAAIVAQTIWGEGRGCGRAGMARIASVMVNRAGHPAWWGNDLASVCLQPFQFSCRNPGDVNLPKLLAVTARDPAYRIATDIAFDAVAGVLADTTKGADSYYALSLAHSPAWAATAERTLVDGWHVFYRTRAIGAEPPEMANVPNISGSKADRLNAAELARIRSKGLSR